MTLQQIRYLVTVAETGSISGAAEMLYVAQSSISSAIKEVEKEYGITVFERTPKGVLLTHRGREFISDIQYILNYQKYVNDKYGIRRNDQKTVLSISTLHHICGDGTFLHILRSADSERYRFDYLREVLLK